MKKTMLLLITCIVRVSACSPANDQKPSPISTIPLPFPPITPAYTATPKLYISTLMAGAYTPRPTAVSDNVKHVSRCESFYPGVRYVVTGENASLISILQINDSGEIYQGNYVVPYCAGFINFEYGDMLHISATVLEGSGPITCQIYNLEGLLVENTSDSTVLCVTAKTLPPG